jgi:hypothetical protein
VSAAPVVDQKIVKTIENALRKPVHFRDIVDATKDTPYRALLVAWSDVRSRLTLERDELGRFWPTDSYPQAARPRPYLPLTGGDRRGRAKARARRVGVFFLVAR